MPTPEKPVAVVTGSSSGIGLETVLELAAQGYMVAATMRSLDRKGLLLEKAAEIGVTDSVFVHQLDITDSAAIPSVVNEIAQRCGRIDCLVNNAGFAMGGFAEDIELDELRKQLETNFFGHTAVTRSVLPVMRRQQRGHIIMVSSISGLAAYPVLSSYAASKFALEGWSEALRMECQGLGIKVVLVEPGAFATDIWTRNVEVGKRAMSDDSPNKERSRRFRDRVVERAPQRSDPRQVARLIVRIAQDSNPKLRYRIGMDAHLQYLLKRILPWKIYERMVIASAKID
jgi:NAD(P)-dependent dehydrogenase (short-subunit alcohol dehydrogenase family)